MTREEKRLRIMAYCNHISDEDCHDKKCPLSNVYGSCFAEDSADIDRNYEILFGAEETVAADPVNHPSHYADGKIEVIDFIEDKKLGFCLGNVVKYIARAGKKDPSKEVEDLKKAAWYVARRIQEIEEGLVND